MLSGFLTFLDVIVMGLCCISLLLTFNSLRRALKLARVGKFAMQQKLRNWARPVLVFTFFLTSLLSNYHFFLPIFILHPSFHFIIPIFLFCLLSLSFLTLPPLSCLVTGNGEFLQKWAKASPKLVGPPPPLLLLAPLQCHQWPGDNCWNLAQDSTQF